MLDHSKAARRQHAKSVPHRPRGKKKVILRATAGTSDVLRGGERPIPASVAYCPRPIYFPLHLTAKRVLVGNWHLNLV